MGEEMKKYIVGGAVRDRLMGRKPKDLDYVWVGATPQDMLNMGFSQVGADFPVFLDSEGNEHALARTEFKVGHGYGGFETRFDPSVTLEQDLHRRDLTINAMAIDPETDELIDPFGGEEDIIDRNLRHVSKAFCEDPLRVLRVARFRARFGKKFRIVEPTMELMREIVEDGEMQHLTTERVWLEMVKAVQETYPELFFMTLNECDALVAMFPIDQVNMLIGGTQELVDVSDFSMESWQRWVSFLTNTRHRPQIALDFLERVGAPNNLKKKVDMGRSLLESIFAISRDEEVEMFLTMIKRFRLNQEENMQELCEIGQTLALTHQVRPVNHIARALRALKLAVNIPVDTTGLKGKEIGEAVEKQRRKILTNMVY